MNRRQFVSSSGAAAALAGIPSSPASAAPPNRALMRLGCQSAPTSEQHLQYLARYGVQGICGYPEIADGRLYATVDELKRMRDLAEKYRITRRYASRPRFWHPATSIVKSTRPSCWPRVPSAIAISRTSRP